MEDDLVFRGDVSIGPQRLAIREICEAEYVYVEGGVTRRQNGVADWTFDADLASDTSLQCRACADAGDALPPTTTTRAASFHVPTQTTTKVGPYGNTRVSSDVLSVHCILVRKTSGTSVDCTGGPAMLTARGTVSPEGAFRASAYKRSSVTGEVNRLSIFGFVNPDGIAIRTLHAEREASSSSTTWRFGVPSIQCLGEKFE
jgi:hypothetical protein